MNAGYPVTDEEYCVFAFKQDGSLMAYNFVQDYSHWELTDNDKILVLNQDEYEILKLTETELEIKYNSLGGYSYSFKALSSVKSVTTGVSALTKSSAILHGVIRTNTTSVTLYFEYGTSTSYGQVISATPASVPAFTKIAIDATVSGLIPETVYHYRVKVVVNSEIFFGQDLIFRTFNTLTVNDIDGNGYNTTTIGSQVWMTENLKTTRYNDGNPIPNVTDNAMWSNLSAPGYCWYENNGATNKNAFGGIYNWYAISTSANGNKNVCPAGWHVPGKAEWMTLIQSLGQNAGSLLSEKGTNASGFSSVGGGVRWADNGSFGSSTGPSYYWTTTEENTNKAFVQLIDFNTESGSLVKQTGCSVRCLKD